jgi:hypothetical protein
VYLQVRYHAAWRTVAAALVPATGRFAMSVVPGPRGTYGYRLYTPGDTLDTAGATISFYVAVS